jgi:hypothetical protein
MKLKKNSVINILVALLLVSITVYIIFNYTQLNTIFDVYEGLRLSYDNVSVEVDPNYKNLPDTLKSHFNEIDRINQKRDRDVSNIASSMRNDSPKLLSLLLRIKQNIELTYPNSVTELTNQKMMDNKTDRTCPTNPSDINYIYTDSIFVIYYLHGILNISDIKKNASKVVEICSGENTGLRYYLKRLMESMNNYVGMAHQNPVSGNGQKIVTEFKSALLLIKRMIYQTEDIIKYNVVDINGSINKIKEYVHGFGRKPQPGQYNNYHNNAKKKNENEHRLPDGAKIVRKGKCYPLFCSWSNE